MTTAPVAVVRDWFDQVWNSGSEEAIARLLAADARMHGLPTPDNQPLVGPAGFTPFWRQFRSAFPDMRIEVERTVAEGEYVAVHCHVTGKHLGHGLGIAATQRPVELWGMGIARVRNGQILEAWNCYDFMSLYQQIGLLPTAGAPATTGAQPGTKAI
jgi:steroid delta-isomerase-like uncharacterized protein